MLTTSVPYDGNFCYPVKEISNDRIKLTPLIPTLHTSSYIAQTSNYPSFYAHVPFGPFSDENSFINTFFPNNAPPNPTKFLFAVIDKTRPGSQEDPDGTLAGLVGYLNTSTVNQSTEIGFVMTLPAFQKTHVTSNAVGLVLHYALETPEKGGLGLRRVQWQTSTANSGSMRVAERMGFVKEGVLRWDRVFKDGKENGKEGNGKRLPEGGGEDLGRDTVMYSLCWDDWEMGGKEKVQAAMDR